MEMYEIGLQAGKKVTEKVDAFILAEHKDETNNFDPTDKRTLSNGSTIYRWYMKWCPYYFEEEKKRFIEVLRQFNDDALENIPDDEIEDYAYKYVAVGDDGGQDECGNEIGQEIFDDLYNARSVTFPASFDEVTKPDPTVDILNELLDKGDRDISAEYFTEMLMDPEWSSYKMFEGLAADYIEGNADVRAGIDKAVSALTGWYMSTIANVLIDRNREEHGDFNENVA